MSNLSDVISRSACDDSAHPETVAIAQLKPSVIQKLNHDLRSPLSAIMGFAALLEDDTLPPDERTDYVAAIRRAAEQMLVTLNGAQAMAATATGNQNITADGSAAASGGSNRNSPAQPRMRVPQLLLGRRVLLADDEPRLRQLTQFCLEKGGAVVTAVADGQEAVDRVLAEPFDVVLMDMQMPVLDGFEAAKRLRDSGYTVPIVAFTAHASPEEWERCLAVGCTRYVGKPFEAETLLRELADAIG